jgi:Ca2+-binding RTX toxin-like protein
LATITGTTGDDVITGTPNADSIDGSNGNDIIHGGGGNDTIVGGPGTDYLYGDDGDDSLVSKRGTGPDYFDGGAGTDKVTVDLAKVTKALSVDLSNPSVLQYFGDGGSIVNVEQISITGGTGNDHFTGGALADTLSGYDGDDVLKGGGGNDTINGGNGYDVAVFSGAAADYTVTLQSDGSYKVVSAAEGTDTLTGIETLRFSDGDRPIQGYTSSAVYWGSANGTATFEGGADVPDGLGAATGTGFTITGLTRADDGTWWAANEGQANSADGTYTPSLVHLAADMTTKIGEISIGSKTTRSLQGLVYNDHELYVASLSERLVKVYSDTGVYLRSIAPTAGTSVNGLAFDTDLNAVIIGHEDGNALVDQVEWRDATTGALIKTLTLANAPDHLFFDASSGAEGSLWYTYGDSGVGATGYVVKVDIATGQELGSFALPNADAVEGIVVEGNQMFLANDAYYHNGNPAENRILTYDITPEAYQLDRSTTSSGVTVDLTQHDQTLSDGTHLVGVERLFFHGGSGNNVVTGGDYADVLVGGSGNDILRGGGGDDRLVGTDGDDTLQGGAGNDGLEGGNGTDTAIYSGNRADYKIVQLSADGVQIIDQRANSPDGTDVVNSVEKFTFSDGTITLAQLLNPAVAPTFGISASTVAENVAPGTVIGTIALTGSSSYTLSLVDNDGGRFALVNGVLVAGQTVIDYEQAHTQQFTLRATDSSGNSYDHVYTIGVTDVNEAPTSLTVANAVTAIAENSNVTGGVKVGDIVLADDALGTNILSLSGADASSFAIHDTAGGGHELWYVGSSPDYETKSSYAVTVNSDDASLGSAYDLHQSFTLSVTDVPEGTPTPVPGVNITGTTGDDTLTGGAGDDKIDGSNGNDTIYGLGGNDTLTGGPGYDKLYGGDGDDTLITKRGTGSDYFDGGAGIDRINVDLGKIAKPLTLDLTNPSVLQNLGDGSSVINVEAATITGGTGADHFIGGAYADSLNGYDGNDILQGNGGNDTLIGGNGTDTAVYLGSRSDYAVTQVSADTISIVDLRTGSPDGTDTVTTVENFTFSDGTYSLAQLLSPTTPPANPGTPVAPTFGLSASTVAENVAPGTAIATLSVAGSSSSYALSLSDNDGGRFALVNGVLVAGNTNIDYEQAHNQQLTVHAIDASGNSFDHVFTIGVTDVNEAPTALAVNNAVTSIAENSNVAGGIKVGDIAITDDALGTNVLSLSGADASAFAIHDTASGGHELWYVGPSPDYESKAAYAVTVNSSDASLGSAADLHQSFTLGVTDVNEAPTSLVVNNAVTSIAENSNVTGGVKVGDILLTDDALGTNMLSLSGTDAASFAIHDTASGGHELWYVGASPDYETQTSYSVTVNSSDASLGSAFDLHQGYTLAVTDQPDTAPVTPVAGVNLTGTTGDDTLTGGAGDDKIDGSNGNDVIYGLGGNDTLTGGPGYDKLYGGDGDDTLITKRGTGSDYFDGGAGIDRINVDLAKIAKPLTLDLTNPSVLQNLGDGSSVINVEAATITGGTGADHFIGGAYADSLNGYDGNDILQGNGGNDTLTGGAGSDHFVFATPTWGNDTVTDFAPGTDFLDFRGSGLTMNDLVITAQGSDVLIGTPDHQSSVLLQHILLGQIHSSDFLF